MSEFRLWVHRHLARLDGARERRFVALATALVLACAALGPDVVRVTAQTINQPDIKIDEIGPDPVPNPVIFKATTENVLVGQLDFLVTMPDGSVVPMPGRRPAGTTDPARWESPPFQGEPGRSYSVAAKSLSSTGESIQSSRSVDFTIFKPLDTATDPPPDTSDDAGSGSSGSETVPGTAEVFQLVAWPGTQPKIEVKGLTSGFIAESAVFRVEHVTGLAFLGEYPGVQGTANDWGAVIPLPGGQVYKVTFIARQAGTDRVSFPREISVPPPETADAPPPTATTPPPATPVVSMLLPHAGSELSSPVALAARVTNATATGLRFEILDPAGVTRIVNAAPGPDGGWTGMFVGEAGQYGVGARTILTDGTQLAPTDFRSFRILAAATDTQTAPPPPPPDATDPVPPPATEPAEAPFIELFSPADGALPFPGTVPLSARVRNGLPDRVVAIVRNAAGAETIVLASKTATGDFWNAIFDGPDGEYRFRMRASVAGTDVFSPERRFAVKRPVATAPLPPPPTGTTTLPPPPPPPPSGTTVAPTGTPTLPPPPTPPTGTTTPETTSVLPPPPPAIPAELAAECRAAGIGPDRCAAWLKTRHQSRECLEAGAVTREACAELLARLNLASGETQLFGLASREEIMRARTDAAALGGKPLRRDELPSAIRALLPVARDPAALVRIVAVAGSKEDSSPALLILDGDGDGLPDDVEPRFGADPSIADTDGDGFDDGTEVKNGYNPAGEGALVRPVRGVEKALLEGLPLEEPRGSETAVDPGFTIEAEASASAEDEGAIRLSGTAAPNSVVTIFVYSYLPVVVTTTTDENGNWTYDFGSELAEGRHEAYVSVNDDTGKLVAASNPLAFFIREAQAVTEEDFLRPDVNVEEAPATFSRWFIYGGIGLVALALILVVAIVRQARKSPLPGSDQGL